MCALSGIIGERCPGGCWDDDPIANDNDGEPGPDNNPHGRHVRCVHKAVIMPDGETKLSATWYECVIREYRAPEDADPIDSAPAPASELRFTLVSNCIHHRTVVTLADSVNIDFPPGNEIDPFEPDDE